MEFYEEILLRALRQQELVVTIPQLEMNTKELLQMECYQALKAVRNIVRNERLDDRQRLERLESLLSLFEQLEHGKNYDVIR